MIEIKSRQEKITGENPLLGLMLQYQRAAQENVSWLTPKVSQTACFYTVITLV
jgi:hypothetical protein